MLKKIVRLDSFFLLVILALASLMSGCSPTDVRSGQRTALNTTLPTTGGVTGGSGAITTGSTTGSTTDDSLPIVEIRNLVEPSIVDDTTYTSGIGTSGAGSYVRKLTLPKNYSGLLYIGGINISTLNNRLIRVRFNFGINHDPIVVQATVARGPGITPDTSIDVLAIDLRNKPFQNIRLLYDLYDYSDYSDSATIAPSSNRNNNLYCRGLKLQDDASFNGQGTCDGRDLNGASLSESCLYTYAKVVDKGLVKKTGTTYTQTYPTVAQVDIAGNGYYKDSLTNMLNRCLPDQASGTFKFSDANTTTGVNAVSFSAFGDVKTIVGTGFAQDYQYEGSFLPVNEGQWGITDLALFGSKGLFDISVPSSVNLDYGYRSLMYPRFGQMNLNGNVQHLSSTTQDGIKTVKTLLSGGQTQWMDGCNLRVASVNAQAEHVGSCNLTANIEVLATDDNGTEYVVASTNNVVLQIVRPSQISSQNGEVLYSNFTACQNSNQCSGGECCYNQRCWNRSLVTQCLEEATTTGNKLVGDPCATDLECTSLCCNRTSGKCAIHNNLLSPPVLCNKPFGDFCLAKEWCQQSVVTTCYIVKTGIDPQGNTTCAKRCYNNLTFGDCKAGVCVPPPQPADVAFDPNANGACSTAIDPPNF